MAQGFSAAFVSVLFFGCSECPFLHIIPGKPQGLFRGSLVSEPVPQKSRELLREPVAWPFQYSSLATSLNGACAKVGPRF